ncbi:hypothetical protein [Candidatus Poriferisodalis sp.]|uniref:hypothetical protein n=1 Tax=Candidatus Poriferisodalis sp. TaxID=3101277 RepID=UPI003C6F5AA3
MQANTTAMGEVVDPVLPLVWTRTRPQHVALPPLVRAVLGAWALVVNGGDRIEAWAPVLLDALAARYGSKPATAEKVTAEVGRLLKFLIARGAVTWRDVFPALVWEWCWAARPDRSGRYRRVSAGTAKVRRWAARAMFETAEMLGADVDAASLVGDPVGDVLPTYSSRPLSDAEALLVREHADFGLWFSSRSAAVALAFAGGTSSDIARVTTGDVNVDAGTVRFGGKVARTNPLDDWGREAITQHLRNRPEATDRRGRLCVSGSLTHERATHSVTVRLRQVVVDAGLGGEPEITARSIRLTTALRIAQQQGIFAAAAFLGNTSLDRTAAALRWRLDPAAHSAEASGG